MRFMRLLTVGLMALFCAGTASAASQLNSVQVSASQPASASVDLHTAGTYAHREYRPDDHMVLVDLTGVTAEASVQRALAFNSSVLKGYKLSSYTSASGIEVTRLELTVGDGVGVEIKDTAFGMKILLSSGAARSKPAAVVPESATAAAAPTAPVRTNTAGTAPTRPLSPVEALKAAQIPEYAKPAAPRREDAPPPAPRPVAAAPVRPAQRSPESQAKATASLSAVTPVAIRSVSVQRGHGTLDVVIEGPSAAHPFLLTNPDRLVVDISNSVLKPGIRNIAVHTRDVLQVRVGRFQAEPPVTRIVIDLSGPRSFDVVTTGKQVVVRVKSEDASRLATPLKTAPAPVLASATAPVVSPAVPPTGALQSAHDSRTALASATRQAPEAAPLPPASTTAQLRDQQLRDSKVAESVVVAPPQVVDVKFPEPKSRAAQASETLSPSSKSSQPVVETAMLNPPLPEQKPVAAAPAQAAPAPAPATAAASPRYTGEPISVNLKDVDLKDFFRLIHEISGLNIVLDPNVKGAVTLVLDDVPWDQALDIVLKNNSLDRELQGNVLRIAATETLRKEAIDRRAQSEAVALAVDRQTISRFLSYAKAKDVVPTIKKFLTARGDVISDERTNALIISDIPSVLPNLDRLISQLDRKSQEVEIEVRVVSATRSFSRDLGFQFGFNWGNGVSTIGGSNPNGSTISNGTTSTSTTGTTTTTTTGTTGVPLFSNFPVSGATTGFSFTNITRGYGIDAVLTAAESHNLAKILSRPRVVTQSNVKAEVKQGVKIPVYTAGTSNANSSVTYIDAVLRLSVTPQITADNTIFLTVDVENTQPSGTINNNYILTTQQATTQVLVTDGGTVVIGGVIQTTNTVSSSQTPVLGDIPWLGNLFKQRTVKTETDELIFFITPKIIQT